MGPDCLSVCVVITISKDNPEHTHSVLKGPIIERVTQLHDSQHPRKAAARAAVAVGVAKTKPEDTFDQIFNVFGSVRLLT